MDSCKSLKVCWIESAIVTCVSLSMDRFIKYVFQFGMAGREWGRFLKIVLYFNINWHVAGS